MVRNIYGKLLKYIGFILIICLFLLLMYKLNNHQNYEIKVVDNLNFETIEFVKVCVINNDDNYEFIKMHFNKDNLIENVFNFYVYGSDELNENYKTINCELYYLDSFRTDKEVLYLYLMDGDNQIDLNVFKIMKITYSFLNINKMVIKYNGKEYKI